MMIDKLMEMEEDEDEDGEKKEKREKRKERKEEEEEQEEALRLIFRDDLDVCLETRGPSPDRV